MPLPPPDPDERIELMKLKAQFEVHLDWLMREHARLPAGNHAQDEVTDAACVCLRELFHIEEVLSLG